jgi:superfamily II DNA or RNA helicase
MFSKFFADSHIANIFSEFLPYIYLGKRGYTIPKKGILEIEEIKKELTFIPKKVEGYGLSPEPISLLKIGKTKLFLPKFYGIEKFGSVFENKLEKKIIQIDVPFEGKIKAKQISPLNICLSEAKKTGGGIVSLPCGSGKTVIALKIISELKVKTLVVVAKQFLMEQWNERIKQFLPSAKVGYLQQKKIDIEGKDIVLGMLQSIAMCDYDDSIYQTFGMVIYDEVHCVPSKVFSKSLQKVQTKYHFGLSATPNRMDGMTKIINLFIGPIIYKINPKNKQKNPKNLHVLIVQMETLPDNKYYKEYLMYCSGKRPVKNIVKMINNISECSLRLHILSNFLISLAEQGRHILVLSERVNYLKLLHETIESLWKNEFEIGYYYGGASSEEQKKCESGKKQLILATYHMAKEAMDIPILNTLVMVHPTGNYGKLEQSIGRILRKDNYGNFPPLIIDYVDNFSSFRTWSSKRISFYKKEHYTVNHFFIKKESLKENIKEEFEKKIKNLFVTNVTEDDIMNPKISDKLLDYIFSKNMNN